MLLGRAVEKRRVPHDNVAAVLADHRRLVRRKVAHAAHAAAECVLLPAPDAGDVEAIGAYVVFGKRLRDEHEVAVAAGEDFVPLQHVERQVAVADGDRPAVDIGAVCHDPAAVAGKVFADLAEDDEAVLVTAGNPYAREPVLRIHEPGYGRALVAVATDDVGSEIRGDDA